MKKYIFTLCCLTLSICGFAQVQVDTFYFTGSSQTFTVGAGNVITFDIRAGKGGDKSISTGGFGGRTQGTMSFNTGDVLEINVGGEGLNSVSNAAGVFVGSGGVTPIPLTPSGGGGTGGGASDIRINGSALSDRIIVAGGGGGAGGDGSTTIDGGDGGGLTGANGATLSAYPNANGKGGSQTSGGTEGTVTGSNCPGYASAGGLGIGGEGTGDLSGGGGGGGGYYGGGGACFNAGGGGSSYTASNFYSITHTQGFQNGDGMIILSYINTSCGPNVTLTTCDSFVSPSGNYTWYTTGIYQDTVSSSPTCTDTVITFDLTIINSYSNTQVMDTCDFYIWPQNGNLYTASGIYTQTFTSANGCDSIFNLDLTILQSSSTNQNVSVCNTYTWAENGVTYTTSINTNITLTAANGCDSTINLMLTILPSDSIYSTVSACEAYFWSSLNQNLTTSGQYVASFQNVNGCDSIEILDLTINNLNLSISQNGDFLMANQGNANYQWLDCFNNFAAINSSTNQTFAPPTDGSYAVIVATPECIDTTECYAIILGIEDIDFKNSLIVSPNPVRDVVNVQLNNTFKNIEIELFDALGKMVHQDKIKDTNQIKFSVSAPAGIYFLKITTSDHSTAVLKIVKE